MDGAMTDPKGDRGLDPSRQVDPDLYLRVVDRREDGIIVRGAKVHQTGITNSHEVIVMPTVAMKPGEEDNAVSFAVPNANCQELFIHFQTMPDFCKYIVLTLSL